MLSSQRDRTEPRAVPPGKWLSFLPFATPILYWLSFHPADQGWLAYVALAPWFLFLILETRVRRACTITFLVWFLFFLIGLNWLRHVTVIGIFTVSAIFGLEMFLFAWVARLWLRRKNDAVGWTALAAMFIGWEFLRSYLFTGFSWFLIGHTQHAYLPLAQAADLGGVPLVGFLVALINTLVAGTAARRLAGVPLGRDLPFAATAAACLLAASSAYGLWRIQSLPKVDALKVGIVQGNVPQDTKDLQRFEHLDYKPIFDEHVRLTLDVRQESDLILWAETMWPDVMTSKRPRNQQFLQNFADRIERPLLVGAIREDGGNTWNCAYFLDDTGEVKGIYDKRHLVIVAEFMPFKDSAPWLYTLIEKITNLKMLGGLNAGTEAPVFEVKGRKFGTLICFDSMWPDQSRAYARGGADFMVCISNDGWFKETEELDQILSVTAFRAIETRMGIARCTNTGISAFIAPDGRIREFSVGGETKSVKGATTGMVSGRVGDTLYVKFGDWFAQGCLILTALLGAFSALPRKKTSAPGEKIPQDPPQVPEA